MLSSGESTLKIAESPDFASHSAMIVQNSLARNSYKLGRKTGHSGMSASLGSSGSSALGAVALSLPGEMEGALAALGESGVSTMSD